MSKSIRKVTISIAMFKKNLLGKSIFQ